MGQMVAVFIALIGGYSFKNISINNNNLNKLLSIFVILILAVMGYEFGSNSSNMFLELKSLSNTIFVFVVLLFILNCTAVHIYAKFVFSNNPSYENNFQNNYLNANIPRLYTYFLESGKYILFIFLGICCGYYLKIKLPHFGIMISLILIMIMFIIGHQLRQQNISIKNFIINRHGVAIAILILISSAVAGIIAAKFLHIDIRIAMVLSSGFGWYTLSGILIGQLADHQFGTIAFFIDFIREIMAIILIPMIGKKYPLSAIAYSGATALDFTLPILKINLSADAIPIAITSGMLLTLFVPIIIPLFWAVL